MKNNQINLFILFLVVCFISCDNSSESDLVTEKFKRHYFEQSIAHIQGNISSKYGLRIETKFKEFYRKYYDTTGKINWDDPDIYGLEEECIDTSMIGRDKNWMRFTINPTFNKIYCIVLERKNAKSYLSIKSTDGTGGYTTGTLDFVVTKIISDSLFLHYQKKLNNLNFYSLSRDVYLGGCRDGDNWTVEAIENGNYNLIYMSCPLNLHDSISTELSKIGGELRSMLHFNLLNDSLSRKSKVY